MTDHPQETTASDVLPAPSIEALQASTQNWSLDSDSKLLSFLNEFGKKLVARTHDVEKAVDKLAHESKCTEARVHNCFNEFHMLSNTQFIE